MLCDFSLDCVMDNLGTLDLPQNADLICTCAPNYNLAACLPSLTKFSARVESDEDLAYSVLALPHLQELHLVLGDSPPTRMQPYHRVLLRADSKLVVLLIAQSHSGTCAEGWRREVSVTTLHPRLLNELVNVIEHEWYECSLYALASSQLLKEIDHDHCKSQEYICSAW